LLVVAQEGDDRLGGNDLDDLVYQWVLGQLTASGRTEMVTALAAPEHLGSALTLLDAVRSAKQDLSEHTTAPVGVSVAWQEMVLTITREEYESLIAEPMARAATLAARALAMSSTTHLAGLYLTGGTAYTPALARALHQVTGILTAPIGDPKLAVAVGALNTPGMVLDPAQLNQLSHELRVRRAQAAPPPIAPPVPPPAGHPGHGPGPMPPPAQPAPPGAPTHAPEPPAPAPAGPHPALVPQPTALVQGQPTPFASPAPFLPDAPRPAPKKKAVKVLAVALVAALLVGGGIVGGVWWNHRESPAPLALATDPPVTCWDGSTGTCPEFAGRAALLYAFTPADPDLCTPGSGIYALGLYYTESCWLNSAHASIQLWQDTNAVANGLADDGYVAEGSWKNDDNEFVGTIYVPGPKTVFSKPGDSTSCYDAIPVCLHTNGFSVPGKFSTLSAQQVQQVKRWLAEHPVPDPTATWSPETALAAFPVVASSDALTCEIYFIFLTPYASAEERYRCTWPDSQSYVYITRWPTPEAATKAWRDEILTTMTEEPWTVDGADRGTVFVNRPADMPEHLDACYRDIPFCISLSGRGTMTAQDYMARIAPLTADQAAALEL
ncbi:MAG: Hsp70 family protein, partial [Micrococcales bacterium]|nr:Hsp70 family protein [Micrococcales bacterium]